MNHLLAYMLHQTTHASPPTAKLTTLADWETTGNWKVDDVGAFALTPRPGETDWTRYGHYLWSKQPYENFEIEFQYKHEKGGNSGFYFNVADRKKAVGSVIEIQIIDSAGQSKISAHGTCGGILPGINPKANAAKPAGQWNSMKIKSIAGEVTVTLNGVLVNQVKLTHPNLQSKPKQGYFGFQDHGLPFWLRNIKLRDLGSGGVAPVLSNDLNIVHRFDPEKPNVFRFEAVEAQYVRVDILPGSKLQPCIDEFEIFAPGAETNVALTGKATASSLLPGYAYKHLIAFLNDGVYGNGRSWIPAKSTGWAQIKLLERSKIDRVVLSRDREGKLRARLLASFDILVSNDGTTWKTVKKVRPRKARMTISEARELFLEDREESPTKESGQKTEEGSKNRLVGGKE
jgi:hypothetical protein